MECRPVKWNTGSKPIEGKEKEHFCVFFLSDFLSFTM